MTAPEGLASVDPTTVDLTDPELYGHGEPHTIFAALRRHDPVHWQAVTGHNGFWSVTRYHDSRAVLANHRAFTSERGTVVNLLGRDDPAGRSQMAVTDPPRHGCLRATVGRPLRAQAIGEHGPWLRQRIRTLLAPAVDGAVIDFAATMMGMSTAIAGLVLDLPPEDWPNLTRLVTVAVAPDDPDFALPGGREATLTKAHHELLGYLHTKTLERRRNPGDDLISALLNTRREDGELLSVSDVVSNCHSIIMGASVTFPHVASSTVLEIASSDRFHEWATHPTLLDTGVEESLRWASPANHFMRYATTDVELSGVKIRAGEAVAVWIGSANRDDSVFADPYRFDIERRPNNHIAFGAGPHFCVGHDAARLTLRLLFEELAATFSDVELAKPAEHLCSNFIAGIKSLSIRAKPRRHAL